MACLELAYWLSGWKRRVPAMGRRALQFLSVARALEAVRIACLSPDTTTSAEDTAAAEYSTEDEPQVLQLPEQRQRFPYVKGRLGRTHHQTPS